MALLQMQNEEVQMRMQDSTAAVVHRQDMLHGRQQKPAMPNEQYPIKYDELWIYENTLITDHGAVRKLHLKLLRGTVDPLSDNVPEWKRRCVFLNCYIKKPSLCARH